MAAEEANSLGDDATFARKATARPQRADVSLGDERTLGGGGAAGFDTVIDDIEVVDLEARYKIEGTLGQGGMGAVLLATDTRLDRKVAIKRILGDAARSKTAIMRFLTEAKAIAALNHPNIVQIYDYGRAKDGPFLIMEHVDGGSVLNLCKQGAMALDTVVNLACQLCEGLAKAHDVGIVHRDIKPANVLISRDGLPKLTDFGLAKAETADHGMTMAGAVMGTPDFMPPEQRRDAAEVDPRSDIWSLAATVYQMATGRSPKVIRLHELPQELQPIIAKALEDEKEARYQSVREFRDALSAAVTGHSMAITSVGAKSVDGALHEGQCKACGTVTSDLSKKFCRNPQCGANLRVACLKCEAQMPVWDGVCGECGGNQPALLETRRASLKDRRAEAERLAANLAFGAAVRCAEGLASETRPEFADLADWARSFVAATHAEATRRSTAMRESLEDVRRHMEECDDSAAIKVIEIIPEPLRNAKITQLLSECCSRHRESTELIAEIAERIKLKHTTGLLPLVERAAELRKDRQDLARIYQQLQDRRDVVLARVKAALDAGDIKQASAVIAGLSADDLGGDGDGLIARIGRASALESELAKAVAAAKSDGVVTPDEARGLLLMCDEYLRLNPQQAKIKELAKQCRVIVHPPPIRNSIGMELRLMPAGTFTMGDAKRFTDGIRPMVKLTKPFYLGVYEVTNAEWKQVMGEAPSHWKYDQRPVEQVSWGDAVEFCRKLSSLPEEQRAGRVYRLPTEAEWEFACRAGTDTRYSFGNDEAELDEYAWYLGNSGSQTHPVGQRKPNAWGLHDMHGNVSEWCSDWYGDEPTSATDPQGPSRASERVARGGAWSSTASLCQSFHRNWYAPSTRNCRLGFRVALTAAGVKPF